MVGYAQANALSARGCEQGIKGCPCLELSAPGQAGPIQINFTFQDNAAAVFTATGTLTHVKPNSPESQIESSTLKCEVALVKND